MDEARQLEPFNELTEEQQEVLMKAIKSIGNVITKVLNKLKELTIEFIDFVKSRIDIDKIDEWNKLDFTIGRQIPFSTRLNLYLNVYLE